ncbi:hypothetical protein FHS31_001688 [Sphingomonas vulcanisoli]|uniref:DUF2188 domain-containing protein n=1 Tax=Sphingomonas vulcanisoli TaxID=1658060 RepID=A0ABX0TRC6_9SPHN|nr:hypothetical protein [Sphingomonas vulcanisoli]NIJ08078.1 hypothetical protein [Sphingomonas vulcanisoli]
MHYYRLYFIGPQGHIEDVRECFVEDDADAVAEAQQLDHGGVIEIWRQGKKITDVQPGAVRRHGRVQSMRRSPAA